MSKKKISKRKRNYLELVIVLTILTLIVFAFDLPKIDFFLIIGVITVISILVFELLGFNEDKK